MLRVIPEQREKSLVEVDSHVPQEMLDKYHDDRAQRVKAHIEAQIAAFYAVRAGEGRRSPSREISVQEGDDVGATHPRRGGGGPPT